MVKFIFIAILLFVINFSYAQDTNIKVTPQAASSAIVVADIDADGEVAPLTDGLLILRYLFGFSGDVLINAALDSECTRCSATEIQSYISTAITNKTLDVDDDNQVEPLTDGLLILRYLFGFTGETLISKAVDDDAKRISASEIAAYISTLTTSPSNTPPSLTKPANQSHRVGSSVSVVLEASDADNDTLTFSASNLPAGLSIDDKTGVISGKPEQVEIKTVTITVTDENAGSASESFDWEIIAADGSQTVAENVDVTLDGEAISGGENIASYSWVQTAGSDVTLSSATIASPVFTAPAVTDPETFTFEVTYTDNTGSSTTVAVNIIIDNDLDTDTVPDSLDDDRDGDGVVNADDFFPDDPDASTVPTVTITSPATLTTVGSTPIRVEGTIDNPTATLTINGIPVNQSGGAFQADVALEEGSNSIIVRAIDAANHAGIATISVSLDKTPPYVTVQNLEDGQTVYNDKIAVTGLVNDIVRGTVAAEDAVVNVNGIQATVSNRAYMAEEIPLVEGENTITVTASDAVGNVGSTSIKVSYQIQKDNIIELVAGQSQEGIIFSKLANPLSIKLTSDGQSVADKNVVFRVIEGDGVLQPDTEDQGNGALATTNADGVASVNFKLGSRAGTGNHQVRARAVGFDGEIVFHASAGYGDGNKLGVIAGNNQRGAVRQPLPQPFTVAITDAGSNLIPDADIEFKVTQGTGKFQNGETTYTVKTDKDGRASVHMTLGAEEGLDVQRVTATLVGTDAIAGFTASGFMPGDPGQTSVIGVVLDNQDNPLPNVTIRIEGTTRQAVSDDEGQFKITEVPVGPVHLIADGSTTTVEGEWPSLSYNIVTVSGVENPLATPIYLVELDTENALTVGEEDVDLTLPEMPGFNLKVKAGSVTFPDGKKTGKLSITPVNANKIPMPPPNGMQPQFIVTIQPHGAKFDPPAELTLPNTDGHLPGAEVEMYSYDHDLEEFVTIGLGTVSKDGSIITSNTGSGVIKAGWHCGSQPGGSGCCQGGEGSSCGECQVSEGSCPSTCKPAPPDTPKTQVQGNCKQELCGGDKPDDSDKPDDECKTCENGDVENVPNEQEKKCGDGSSEQACLVCIDGACRPPECEIENKDTTLRVDSDPVFNNFSGKVKSVVNKIPYITIHKADLTVRGSITEGERCCKNCSDTSQQKGDYYSAALTGLLDLQAEGHYGPNINKPFNYAIKGYGVSGQFKFKMGITLAVSTRPQANVKGSYVEQCEEGCVSLNGGADIAVTGTITALDTKVLANVLLAGKPKNIFDIEVLAAAKGRFGTSGVNMNLLSKGEGCPESCTYFIGGGSGEINAKLRITLLGYEILPMPKVNVIQEFWKPITGVCQ